MEGPFRSFWRWFLAANVTLWLVGSCIFAYAARGRPAYLALLAVAVVVLVVCDAGAIDRVYSIRWGPGRARSTWWRAVWPS